MNVFVTGASSGIGAALARHYAQRGATLGLVARRNAELTRVAGTLAPARVASYAIDVRDAGALRVAGNDFSARFGLPDIVIANAGVSRGTLTEVPDDVQVFRVVMDTNMLGMLHTFAPFVAAMRRRRSGILVGVASVAGFRGMPGSGAYCASKAAAIAYLESLRVELAGSGVAVVTICPGYIATPMTAVNTYRMPFLLQPDVAAARIAKAIAAKRRFYVLPRRMALAGWLLRRLPRPVFDAVFRHAPRKPRQFD